MKRRTEKGTVGEDSEGHNTIGTTGNGRTLL